MFKRSRKPSSAEARRIIDTIKSETRSYTDPSANYPIARQARREQAVGAFRRRPPR